MNKYVKLLALAVLLLEICFQIGCDQSEPVTESTGSQAVLGKGSGVEGLGERLAADPAFKALRRLLHDADARARLKYVAGASLKHDLAFARQAEKKRSLSAADRAKLMQIRGFSESDFEQVDELRKTILSRFPEIRQLSEEELQEVFVGAGVGKTNAVGKVLDKCSDCYYAYNTCINSAELRHAIETFSCVLLVETLFGGTACYLVSLSKYLWSVSMCSSTKSYCLTANDCLSPVVRDTL